jgi:hypothetical protein
MTDIQSNKPLCFVIMPFSEKNDEIYEIIKNAGNMAGFQTQRADEKYEPGKIPDRIQYLLNSASILIAEISEQNPNVYYELGFAHAIDKPVILICQKGSEIPFDVNHWNQIRYNELPDLGLELARVLIEIKKNLNTKSPSTPVKALSPMDVELGQLAVRCEMIKPWILEKRLEELKAENSPHDNITDLLVYTNDIDKDQAQMLLQAQKWVNEYFNSVSKSLKETVWINRIHRTVKFIHCQDKFRGDHPAERRYIPLLDEEVDIYDEAIYTDYIVFLKFTEATFSTRSTGLVLLQEADTDEYSISISDTQRKYYKTSGGHSLDYNISAKDNSTYPLIVNRTSTFINGFQLDDSEDNREIGIEIREPTEEVMLMVDFHLLPVQVNEIVAELRRQEVVEKLEIKKSSYHSFYTTKSFPPIGSSIYIKWKWGKDMDQRQVTVTKKKQLSS